LNMTRRMIHSRGSVNDRVVDADAPDYPSPRESGGEGGPNEVEDRVGGR
jgi:hypothetical protein